MRMISSMFLALFITITLMISGCAQTSGNAKTKTASYSNPPKEILVINHTSLTGSLSDYGRAAKIGVELAAKDIGTFAVRDKKYRIKIMTIDDKGEADIAANLAQEAVEKGAVAVIGALTSGNTAASQPIYKHANIPMISPSATQTDLTEHNYTNFFRTCMRDDIQGRILAQMAQQLGYRKITVMDDRGDYGQELGDIVEETLKQEGLTVERLHIIDDKQTKFSTAIRKMKDFKPEAIIFTAYHRQAGLLRQQMIKEGLKDVRMIGGDGIKSDLIFAEAGGPENIEGTLCTFGLDRSHMPKYAEFRDKYMKVTSDKEPGPYSENAYDSLGVVIAAVKNTNSTEGQKLIDELHKIKYTGVLGTFSFDEQGDIKIPGGISKFIAQDGKWVPYQVRKK